MHRHMTLGRGRGALYPPKKKIRQHQIKLKTLFNIVEERFNFFFNFDVSAV